MSVRPVVDHSGLVVNIVEVAEGAAWEPPEGCTLGPEGGRIGDTWNGNGYVSPPVEEPSPADLKKQRLDNLQKLAVAESWRDAVARRALSAPARSVKRTELETERDRWAAEVERLDALLWA